MIQTTFDTATQLMSAAIAKFKNAGLEIVGGYYLTGTVVECYKFMFK